MLRDARELIGSQFLSFKCSHIQAAISRSCNLFAYESQQTELVEIFELKICKFDKREKEIKVALKNSKRNEATDFFSES